MKFAIWVDGDSCPQSVREMITRTGKRLGLRVFFVANRVIPFEENALFSMIVCPAESGAADDYIFLNASEADIVVTRDIPLAMRLVEKGLVVLNDRGTVFDEKNIRDRLAVRNLNLHLAEMGIIGEKTSRFGKKEVSAFANALDREVQKKIRVRTK